MLMGIKDFLAPTRGRILLFLIIFIMIFLYDTAFAPFPGSPVAENLSTQDGASSFVLYILLLPYILSCLIPAFFGLRKKRFWRLSSLKEFMHPRHGFERQKPTRQQQFVFPPGTEVVESVQPPQTASQAPAQAPSLPAAHDSGETPEGSPPSQKANTSRPASKRPSSPKKPARQVKKLSSGKAKK